LSYEAEKLARRNGQRLSDALAVSQVSKDNFISSTLVKPSANCSSIPFFVVYKRDWSALQHVGSLAETERTAKWR
jgi:hypothetical protein